MVWNEFLSPLIFISNSPSSSRATCQCIYRIKIPDIPKFNKFLLSAVHVTALTDATQYTYTIAVTSRAIQYIFFLIQSNNHKLCLYWHSVLKHLFPVKTFISSFVYCEHIYTLIFLLNALISIKNGQIQDWHKKGYKTS